MYYLKYSDLGKSATWEESARGNMSTSMLLMMKPIFLLLLDE